MPRKGPEAKRIYRDLVTLGSGGMAKVYRARQEALDRDVAIKELREELARDPSIVARFEREAKYAAALQHESIVHVYDFFKEENSYYIVMEFVDGTDLGAILKKSGAVPPEIAAIVVLRLVRALEHAHRHGIIHRDIKPGNILVSKTGDLKLSDFGIAKEPDPADMKADLTRTGQAIGTPSYMSPEQIMGDMLTFNSDLFSAGIVLYELLVGAKPFTSDTATSLLDKIRSQGYTDVRNAKGGVPRALAKIVRRSLKKEPRKRWTSTTELRHALEDFVRRNVRIAPEEALHAWLVANGIFPPPSKPVSVATTNVAGSMAHPSMIRTWAPRAAAGGLLVMGIAAALAWTPGWLTTKSPLPMPSPPGPMARPSFAATATASAATPTPSPTPSASPTSTPNVTPIAAMVVDTHHEPIATKTTVAPVETAAPAVTPASTTAVSPRASATAKPSPRVVASSTPRATPTPAPSAKPTASPRASAKPSPSPTATPRRSRTGSTGDTKIRSRRY